MSIVRYFITLLALSAIVVALVALHEPQAEGSGSYRVPVPSPKGVGTALRENLEYGEKIYSDPNLPAKGHKTCEACHGNKKKRLKPKVRLKRRKLIKLRKEKKFEEAIQKCIQAKDRCASSLKGEHVTFALKALELFIRYEYGLR